MTRPLEVRMAVVEERLTSVEEEQLRQRQRLHEIEGDRATLGLLTEQVRQLAATVETTAKRAAQEAIDLAMDHRDELGRRRWALRLQWAGVGVSFGGFVSALVFQLIR